MKENKKKKQKTTASAKARDYDDYPAFAEKAKADREFLEKYGLPKELQDKYGFKPAG